MMNPELAAALNDAELIDPAEIKLTVINEFHARSLYPNEYGDMDWIDAGDGEWVIYSEPLDNTSIIPVLSMRFKAWITISMSWKHMPLNGNKIVLTGRKNTPVS